MSRIVILFDFTGLLRQPCPILFPEQQNSLYIVSVDTRKEPDWRECAEIIHHTQENHIDLEYAFVHDTAKLLKNSTVNYCDYADAEAKLIAKAPKLFQDSYASKLAASIFLIKLPLADSVNKRVEINFSAIAANKRMVALYIEYHSDKHHQSFNLYTYNYLLPMGVYFYLNRSMLSVRQNEHSCVEHVWINASHKKLDTMLTHYNTYLNHVYKFIKKNKAQFLLDSLSQTVFYAAHLNHLYTTDVPQFTLDDLNFGLLYKISFDDEKFISWLANEKQKSVNKFSAFQTALQTEHENALTQVAYLEKDKSTDEFLKQVAFEKEAFEKEPLRLSDIDQHLKEKKQQINLTSVKVLSVEALYKTWVHKYYASINMAIKNRPTKLSVLLIFSVLMFAVMTLLLFATGVITNTHRTVNFLPIQFDIVLPIFMAVITLLIAQILYAVISRYRSLTALLHTAQLELQTLNNSLQKNAQQLLEQKKGLTHAMCIGKNQEIISSLLETEKLQQRQIESYLHSVSEVIQQLPNRMATNFDNTDTFFNSSFYKPIAFYKHDNSLYWGGQKFNEFIQHQDNKVTPIPQIIINENASYDLNKQLTNRLKGLDNVRYEG